MLKTDVRFKNGILLIKATGSINKDTYQEFDKDMTSLIINNGIRYVLLNLKETEYIDSYGLEILQKNYQNIKNNDGKLIICGMKKLFKTIKITDNLYQIDAEEKVDEVIAL